MFCFSCLLLGKVRELFLVRVYFRECIGTRTVAYMLILVCLKWGDIILRSLKFGWWSDTVFSLQKTWCGNNFCTFLWSAHYCTGFCSMADSYIARKHCVLIGWHSTPCQSGYLPIWVEYKYACRPCLGACERVQKNPELLTTAIFITHYAISRQ